MQIASNLEQSRVQYGDLLKRVIDEYHTLIEKNSDLIHESLINNLIQLNI